MQQNGIIYDIKKFAIHDGPGIRTTVFFKGCPLDCWWCHNPESRSKVKEARRNLLPRKNHPLFNRNHGMIGIDVSVEDVMIEIRKDMIFYEQSGGGVTFSGGEPMLQVDFLNGLLTACKNENIHTAVDTSGYIEWKSYEKVISNVGLFLYDVKLVDPELHKKYIGVDNELILRNLEKLTKVHKNIVIRIPLIPGITDTPENLNSIKMALKDYQKVVSVDLLTYNAMGESKYHRLNRKHRVGKLKIQSIAEIEKIKMNFRNTGFNVT